MPLPFLGAAATGAAAFAYGKSKLPAWLGGDAVDVETGAKAPSGSGGSRRRSGGIGALGWAGIGALVLGFFFVAAKYRILR